MKHFLITTEAEYDQFIADRKELEEYRRLKNNLPDRIRRYFNRVKGYVEENRTPMVVFKECAQEGQNRTYCDMCPAGAFFDKCPLGHSEEYSK